jgi:hypothetical protein
MATEAYKNYQRNKKKLLLIFALYLAAALNKEDTSTNL